MKRLFLSVLAVLIVAGLLGQAAGSPRTKSGQPDAAVDRDTLSVGETLVLSTLSTPDRSMPQRACRHWMIFGWLETANPRKPA